MRLESAAVAAMLRDRTLLLGLCGLLAFAAGCASHPESHKLGLILRDTSGMKLRILERDVSALHCPRTLRGSGDIGEAVEQAISGVPGAMLLVDVRVIADDEPSRGALPMKPVQQCILVVGHAATFE